jgi:hypothetical protein
MTRSNQSHEWARRRLAAHLQHNYPEVALEDLEPTPVPGYWRVKGGCPGGADCRHAYRDAIGPCDGGHPLTIPYMEPGARDHRGRYVSPYRVWRLLATSV